SARRCDAAREDGPARAPHCRTLVLASRARAGARVDAAQRRRRVARRPDRGRPRFVSAMPLRTFVYTFESASTLAVARRLAATGKIPGVILQRPMGFSAK